MRLLVALAASLALVPLFADQAYVLGLFILLLFSAYLGQAWNISGGFCGLFSLGHAAFFGVGLYIGIILQEHGVPGSAAFVAAGLAGAAVAAGMGHVSFRYGLKGSYFALVTLAFTEIFRVVANASVITGGGRGAHLAMNYQPANLQFSTKAGYFYFVLIMFVAIQALALWIKRSRLGAQLIAVREDEDAAQALAVGVFRVKMIAITLSGALTGLGGFFYAQYYMYTDPFIAFGAARSMEILLVPIIGGLGTVWGPFIGAFSLRVISDVTQELTGNAPGLNLALYGLIVILIVRFAPNGVMGGVRAIRSAIFRGRVSAATSKVNAHAVG